MMFNVEKLKNRLNDSIKVLDATHNEFMERVIKRNNDIDALNQSIEDKVNILQREVYTTKSNSFFRRLFRNVKTQLFVTEYGTKLVGDILEIYDTVDTTNGCIGEVRIEFGDSSNKNHICIIYGLERYNSNFKTYLFDGDICIKVRRLGLESTYSSIGSASRDCKRLLTKLELVGTEVVELSSEEEKLIYYNKKM